MVLVFQELPGDGGLAAAGRATHPRFYSRAQWGAIVAVGAMVTAVVMFSYLRSLGAGYDVEHARAMALVALTVASAAITAGLSRLRGRAARILVLATVASSLLFVQTPALASFLHLRPLHLDDWLLAIGGGLPASALLVVTSILRRRARAILEYSQLSPRHRIRSSVRWQGGPFHHGPRVVLVHDTTRDILVV
jgi:Ca2+-transporting ATPase